MNITYHLKHLYGDKFSISATVKGFKRDIDVRCRTTLKQNTLTELRKRAYACLKTTMFRIRKEDPENVPHAETAGDKFIWDNDTSEMGNYFNNNCTGVMIKKTANVVTSEPEEPQLYEVYTDEYGIKQLIKHKDQLLTWEEACALLKEKLNEKGEEHVLVED